eukprot:scaffold652_cov188-Chaetoceros_neogracile.AAC.17
MGLQQKLDEILVGYEGCPGLQVVVVSPKGVLYRGAVGFTDDPITTNHVGNLYFDSTHEFVILSQSKTGKRSLMIAP